MYDGRIDYDAIQRRVTQRVKRRYRFFFHTAIFLLGIPLAGSPQTPWVLLFWIGAWAVHFIWNSYQGQLEQAIDEEIAFEHERLYKRKREFTQLYREMNPPDDENHAAPHPAWLGDDGEIIDPDAY